MACPNCKEEWFDPMSRSKPVDAPQDAVNSLIGSLNYLREQKLRGVVVRVELAEGSIR